MRQKRYTATTHRIKIAAPLALALILCLMAALAFAAPGTPVWLPGQPLLAGNQVIAMWLPVPGAVKYVVYINGKKAAESPANQYMAPAPDEAGEYAFQVSSVDASGAESPLSSPGKITIIKIIPPPAPIYRAVWEDKSASLRWEPVQGGIIYNLYRGEQEGGPYKLLSSSQELAYKDVGLEPGKEYYYRVSVKDVTGKESNKGPAVKMVLEEPVAAAGEAAKQWALQVLPTRTVKLVRDFVDPKTGEFIPVRVVTALRRNPAGEWYLSFGADRFLVLDGMFQLQRVLEVKQGSRLKPLPRKPAIRDLSFDADGTIYASDKTNAMVHEVDPDTGEILRNIKIRKPTVKEDEKTYNSMLARHRQTPSKPGASAVLPDGRLVVSDSGIYVVVDLDSGEIQQWFSIYRKGDRETQMGESKDVIHVRDSVLLFAQPLERKIVIMDVDTGEASVVISRPTGLGSFVGMGGVCLDPNGNLAVSDPTLGTVQVFSLEGEYIYSVGGPEGKAFDKDPSRALVDFRSPTYPVFLEDGKFFIIFNGLDNYFYYREILAPIPTAGIPAA